MTGLTKSAIALGTIGGLGGVGYVVKQQLTTEANTLDIGVELINEDYLILDNNSEEWTEILKSYQETVTDKPNLKFPNLTGTVSVSELQRVCNEATNVKTSENKDPDLRERARMWCTKPRTLEDMLSKKGYRFLDTDSSASDEKDVNEWNQILDKYKASNEIAKKFTEVEILAATDSTSGAKKDKTERNKLKTKCTPLKDKKHHTKGFAEELEKAVLWCAIKLPK